MAASGIQSVGGDLTDTSKECVRRLSVTLTCKKKGWLTADRTADLPSGVHLPWVIPYEVNQGLPVQIIDFDDILLIKT